MTEAWARSHELKQRAINDEGGRVTMSPVGPSAQRLILLER